MNKLNSIIHENNLDSWVGEYRGDPFLVVSSHAELETIEKNIDLNIDYGFNDEYTSCGGCGCIVRTSPDSYNWMQKYHIFDGELLCIDCVDFEDYIENIENNFKSANTIFEHEDFLKNGYEKLNLEEYENGFYGTEDDPQKIYQGLEGKYNSIVFSISEVQQFALFFDIYVKGVL